MFLLSEFPPPLGFSMEVFPWFGRGDGIFRLGGSTSRRSSPLSVPFGTSVNSSKRIRSSQHSLSVGDSRGNSRPHVDIMVVRCKQVARALFSRDDSCEILSRMSAKEGPCFAEQGESIGVVEKRVDSVAKREESTTSFTDEADELYRDLGLPLEPSQVESGIGPSNLGYGVKTQNQVTSGLFHGVNNMAASAPFVFGSYSSSSSQLARKWRKVARASQNHSGGVLAGQGNGMERRKRASGSSIMGPTCGSLAKRSRQHVKEVDLVDNVDREAVVLATNTVGAPAGKQVVVPGEGRG
ncbi:RNA-dependent RNA polymerase [Corchorus olitorius]|uniref:RNA-dependent RNA polymerase n=1 Tax=Corchorus olitorius TaxID=93759 RepID=A0A1R3KF80_9ROSI|nr:RNA-dependent RNA polymerase [Corchorus olitorius]